MDCDCNRTKNLTNIDYPDVANRSHCNKCEIECDGPQGPKNMPIFNTTYVGRATRHRANQRLSYYDCSKKRGGKCGNKKCIEHLPDTNYWHYCLQLNTYKAIIEEKYGKKVTDLFLVCLHPDNNNKSYKRIKVVDLQSEV